MRSKSIFAAVAIVFVLSSTSGGQAPKGGGPDQAGKPAALDVQKPWQTPRYCGVNSLYALMRLERIPIEHATLAEELAVTERGASLEDLHGFAEKHGLSNDVIKSTPAELRTMRFPAIAHLKGGRDEGHYVVLCGMTYHNPSLIRVSLLDGTSCLFEERDLGGFVRDWSGYLLVPRPSPTMIVLRYALYALLAALALSCLVLVWEFVPRKPGGAREPAVAEGISWPQDTASPVSPSS